MADKLILHELAVDCRIGVFEWEREHPQTLLVDIELAIDAAAAALNDDMRSAIDYARLVTLVRQHAESRHFKLIETLAHQLAELILKETRTARAKVTIKKRALPNLGYAAVQVERGGA